jgi:hypothetical protein
MPRSKPKSKPRVSRITIGRLYNLGNYEHVRYELTVDVPAGVKPSHALTQMLRVLKAANPKPPCSAYEIRTAREALAKDPATLSQYDRDNLETFKERVSRYDEWLALKERAVRILDEMGGSRVEVDAKEAWGFEDA